MPPDSGARKLSHWVSTPSRFAVCLHHEVNWSHCVGVNIDATSPAVLDYAGG